MHACIWNEACNSMRCRAGMQGNLNRCMHTLLIEADVAYPTGVCVVRHCCWIIRWLGSSDHDEDSLMLSVSVR